jgi:hypothetical protein
MDWNAAAGTKTLGIHGKADDVLNWSAGVAATTVQQGLTVSASSSATALPTFAQSFVGWLPTDNKGYLWSGTTFKSCGTVTIAGGGDLTNVTIAKTTSTNAALAITANGSVLDSCTITVADTTVLTDYHLELGTAVTSVTLTDVTFSGTSNSTGSDNVHVLKTLTTVTAGSFVVGVHYRINTVGSTDFTLIGASANTIGVNFTATGVGSGTGTADQAVKITISGTTSLAEADCTTAGAPAWVAAPALNQVVVVSGFTAGSRIQIYDTTSSTELFNGTASAGDTVVTGSTATWTDPLAASANRAIRVRVAYISGVTAEQWQQFSGLTCGQTSGTESITYPVTPIDDTTYNDNGIDGPTIYATSGITFTDAATDLVNISIAGGTVTWATIYACFVYWLSTAAGIDDDVAYIDAPDTANYLLTSMKLKNTHANPLTVTSGYGRSATTGLVADIIDTAGSTGNIFPSPDHVVAYATGSGALTAGDITNIWSAATRTITTTIPTASQVSTQVLADAATTPIASNIKKVNDITVDGNGQDATPWGPV